MYKVIIITDPDSATGFRLAGAEVIDADSPELAGCIIGDLLAGQDAGIIAVREDYYSAMDKSLLDKVERSYHPVIIPIPAPRKDDEESGYVERLLRRAIGYNVVMRS